MPAKLKKKTKQRDDEDTVELDVSESFDVADAKDDSIELDMDAGRFQGASGQCGTRTKD